MEFISEDSTKQYLSVNRENGQYSLKTDIPSISPTYWQEGEPLNGEVTFQSFLPYSFLSSEGQEESILNLSDIRELLIRSFENMEYIGPIRLEPKEFYIPSKRAKKVGKDGALLAQVLERESDKPLSFYEFEETKGSFNYTKKKKNLIDHVNYWICEVFELAKEVRVDIVSETYRIILVNNEGQEISLRHMGFGISQLLPIVVSGLLLNQYGTLVVEQPEVHLHPKVQSSLFDFLYGLIKSDKRVIVETHSSHFVTRMRRRIVEDPNAVMHEQLSLTFIENNLFRTLKLDDYGTLDYFPEDFIEASSKELGAIVSAQMKKKLEQDNK